jgi:hypothetical protein
MRILKFINRIDAHRLNKKCKKLKLSTTCVFNGKLSSWFFISETDYEDLIHLKIK